MEKQITIRTPNMDRLKARRDRYNGPKFFVALLLPIAAVVATYYGLIKMPAAASSSILVVVLMVAFVAFMTYALNKSSKKWLITAAFVAFVAGIVIALNWSSISSAFGNFHFADLFWLLVALAIDVLFAFWVSRNVVVATPDPTTRRGARAATPPSGDTTTSGKAPATDNATTAH